MGKQLKLDLGPCSSHEGENVPFVNEVEEFNATFNKPNNYEPTIPEKKEWQFVYDFVLEELEEYRQACENGDIVTVSMASFLVLQVLDILLACTS